MRGTDQQKSLCAKARSGLARGADGPVVSAKSAWGGIGGDRAGLGLSARLMMSSAAAVWAVAMAGAATAQTATTGASGQTTTIQEVVVTAQRRSENVQNVPVSVQALSGAALQRQGIKSSSDLAAVIPNVTIALPNGEGNQPAITIRGIGLNDFNSNNAGPNGVYVDDVYMSAPAMQTFALFDLDQVQVLKGPQGTLYGRNTSGGAIVMTSARPTDTFTGVGHVEYSSFNSYQISGAVGGPLVQDIDARLAFVVNHSDGFMRNQLTDSPASGTDNQAGRLQLLYKPNDHLKILFSSTIGAVGNGVTQYRHIGDLAPGTQASGSPTVCGVQQAYAGGCVDMFGAGTPSNFYSGAFGRKGNLSVHNNVEFIRVDYTQGPYSLTSISAYAGSQKNHPEDTSASANDLLDATYGVSSDTFTQEVRGAYSGQNAHAVLGAYYLRETLRQDQPLSLFHDGDLFGGLGVPPGQGAFDGVAQLSQDHSKQISESAALFGQGDYSWNGFTLTLGGRYTHETKRFDYLGWTQYQSGGIGDYGPIQGVIAHDESLSSSNFTWRTALAYHLTRDIMGYASAATGFKAGGFNGSFLSNNLQQALFQLRPIKPEHVTAYEIGFKTSFLGRRLVANGAAFYNDYQDEQIYLNLPQTIDTAVGPVQQVTNVLANAKKAHTEGVELSVTAAPLPGLTLTAEPAWLRTRLDDAGIATLDGSLGLNGKQLANAPHFSFYGAIDYSFSVRDGDKVELEVSTTYKSHQYFDSTNDPYTTQAGYWVNNASLTYTLDSHWQVMAFAHNFTDTKYLTYAFDLTSPFGFIQGFLGAPRTVGAGVTYKF